MLLFVGMLYCIQDLCILTVVFSCASELCTVYWGVCVLCCEVLLCVGIGYCILGGLCV